MSEPLPKLQQAELSPDAVDALLDDLAALTEVREVRLKGGVERYADAAPCDLARARAVLQAAERIAVQIRYRHDEVEWCDTLIPIGGRVRLVRIAQR